MPRTEQLDWEERGRLRSGDLCNTVLKAAPVGIQSKNRKERVMV